MRAGPVRAGPVRHCAVAGMPGLLGARPTALRACPAGPARRRARTVVPLALASPPSRPSGDFPAGPLRADARAVSRLPPRAAANDPSPVLPATGGGAGRVFLHN